MATASVIHPITVPRDVHTTLNYYFPTDSEPPYNYVYDPPPNVPRTNIGLEPRSVVIQDVRGTELEHAASLDVHGFQFVRHTSTEVAFVDEARIKDVYYKEIEELLKRDIPSAKRVFIFDHTVR